MNEPLVSTQVIYHRVFNFKLPTTAHLHGAFEYKSINTNMNININITLT